MATCRIARVLSGSTAAIATARQVLAAAGLMLAALAPSVTAATCAHTTSAVLVRHGQTRWNVLGLLQGTADVPLDEKGRAEADALGRALAGTAIDAVYSSPLARALDTARAIAAPHGLAIEPRESLREIGVGIYTGHAPSRIPEAVRAAWGSHPDVAMPSGIPDPEGLDEASLVRGRWFEGESLNAAADRSWREVRSLVAQHCGQRLVIVTHGGAIQVILTRAKGVPVTEFRKFAVPNASMSTLEFRPDGSVAVTPSP